MVSQNLRKEKTLSAILASAHKCFGEIGYSKTSIDMIAKRADLTKGAVYHHFASKAQMFEKVHELISSELSQSVMASLGSDGDLFQTVRTALKAFFYECRDEKIIRIIFQDGPIVLGEERWREIDQKNFGGQIKGVLAMGMQAGLIETHPLEPLGNLFNSTINESILQCIRAEDFDQASRQYIDTIMVLLLGISIPQA